MNRIPESVKKIGESGERKVVMFPWCWRLKLGIFLQVTLEEATALLTEFESSDMETETDADFGLDGEALDADSSVNSESAKRSKCQYSLGSP